MTKAFWEILGEIHKKSAGFRDAIQLKNAHYQIASPLHGGAVKYYKEIGIKVPEHLIPN